MSLNTMIIKKRKTSITPSTTSWEPVEKWYQGSVGEEGHYYHQHIILPGLMKLLDLHAVSDPSVLDLACGPGVLARHLPTQVFYTGIDLSPSLIQAAKKGDSNPHHSYYVSDVTKPLPLAKKDFSHVVIVLGIQNIAKPDRVLQNAAKHLTPNGKLVLIINHPCFRIPRQSSWKVDEQQDIQFRRIDRYSSSLHVPIQTHPSKGKRSATTWSFHYPLSTYSRWLYEAGFNIELIEEWHSDKTSSGKAAKRENRSRAEIPLFMAIRVCKSR
jgi:ubiquinone/menaquinone biosynthesis C-methylase UbiE